MSMLTELWGEEAINWSLNKLKYEIKQLPETWSERKSYILHDWAAINNRTLTHQDYIDVGAKPQTKDDTIEE